MADETTEIRTFLIADVRGYTRYTQEQGDEAAARLAERFAVVVGEQITARGGQVVELRGDEALCVFGSPRAALRAAVDLQRRCADEIRADASLPLRVGIGIDAGEAVAVEDGAVWVANAADGTVTRLDPASGQTRVVGGVGRDPQGLTYANGSVWVADGLGGQVARIDARSLNVSLTSVTGATHGVAVTGGRVWVTALASPGSHRGGRLRLEMDPAPDSLDPAFSFYPPAWQMLGVTNDGLVGYRRVGGPAGAQVVPDLAVSLPAISNGGHAYTFQLRRGIRYSDGRLVEASDVRFAIERQFGGPSLPGPQIVFSNLLGAERCMHSPAPCSLARGIEVDDSLATVTFHLTHPDPNFLQKLALPFGDLVHPGAPPPGSTSRVPATGPYMIDEYVPTGPNAHVLLVRNPRFHEWSADAQPAGYPDSMRWTINVAPAQELTDVEQGHTDVMVEQVPADHLSDVAGRYAALAHPYSAGALSYLFLNTRIPPFSSLAARRALNFAVDRVRLIHDWVGGPLAASPTCQILPPSFPGYSPYCPYTSSPGPSGVWTAPDLARSQRLVRESGPRGDRVTLWASPNATARGSFPTGSRATTRSACGSTRTSVFEPASVTHTAPPPAATPVRPLPTESGGAATSVFGSSR